MKKKKERTKELKRMGRGDEEQTQIILKIPINKQHNTMELQRTRSEIRRGPALDKQDTSFLYLLKRGYALKHQI